MPPCGTKRVEVAVNTPVKLMSPNCVHPGAKAPDSKPPLMIEQPAASHVLPSPLYVPLWAAQSPDVETKHPMHGRQHAPKGQAEVAQVLKSPW